MGLDGHQAYQFRRVEAGVEVLRVALDRVPSPATEHLIADLQKDLLLLGVMLPASSPPKPAEPEGILCDAGVPGGSSPEFEKWWENYTGGASQPGERGLAAVAYQAGQESLLGTGEEDGTLAAMIRIYTEKPPTSPEQEALRGAAIEAVELQARVRELEEALGKFMAGYEDFIQLTGGRDMVRHPLRKQIEDSRVAETYLAARLVIEKQAQEAPVDA